MTLKFFICGITGTQGGALARQLLSSTSTSPVAIHGLSRNPTSPAAVAITTLGATIFPGSYDNTSALQTALSGCTAIFLNLGPDWTDSAAERRHGLAVLAAAAAASTVTHVVYSSALSVNAPESLANYEPESIIAHMLHDKHSLEAATRDWASPARASSIKHYTILRPGNFMSNYTGTPAVQRQQELITQGVTTTAFAPQTMIPMVDVETIAAFARAALLDSDRFHGKEIGLADEFLTLDETLVKLSAVAGRKLTARYLTDDEIQEQKKTNPIVDAQLLMRGMAKFVNLDEVKSWGVMTSSFEEFLKREAASIKDTYTLEAKTA